MKSPVAAALLLLPPLLLLAAGVASAATGDPLVLIERIVDARYGQTDQANEDLDKGLQSSLHYEYKVKPGETLQHITGSLFAIDPAHAKSSYSKLAGTIKSLNGLGDVNRLKSGQTLLVPYLPRKQPQAIRAPASLSDLLPRIRLGPSRREVLTGRAYNFALGATSLSADLAAPAATPTPSQSPLVRQLLWTPASQVRGDPTITVIAQPVRVRFHAASAAGAVDDLSHDIAILQQGAASHPPVHESIVYILDDSWPDAKSFTESIQFLHHADAVIRDKFHLGAASWPDSLTAPGATTTFPWLANGTTSHAAEIESSLQPFTAISTAVRVIYVPLFIAQTGASDVLKELMLVSLIAHYKQKHLQDTLTDTALAYYTAKATAVRDQIAESLPDHQSNQPADTDQAVITALLSFAQLYAQATGQPFFLNTSWVVDQYEFEFGPPPNVLGVTLAAAGDNPAIDIFASNVLLASRARPFPGDVIAVMNNHPDGSRDGCTSYWPAGTGIYGLTYDGFLSNTLCGTSFSAPRIAWMLALRESRQPLVSDTNAQSTWFQNYRNFILRLQDSTRSQDLRYWLSPAAIF